MENPHDKQGDQGVHYADDIVFDKVQQGCDLGLMVDVLVNIELMA